MSRRPRPRAPYVRSRVPGPAAPLERRHRANVVDLLVLLIDIRQVGDPFARTYNLAGVKQKAPT